MTRHLVPIKVTIGLRRNGHADHPNFNTLPSVIASGMDWSKYIDVHGTGWLYDNCCGHKDDTDESPHGQQFGCMFILKVFADEAIAAFPALVVKLGVNEIADFYNDHFAKEFPEVDIDNSVLAAVRAHRDSGLPDPQWILDAVDPTNEARGIQNSKRKTFDQFRAAKNITVAE